MTSEPDQVPWHDDDEFWAAIEPALFSSERAGSAAGDVEAISKLLRVRAGARVLDLCTGPGRHAIELARRGYLVTGVDRTHRYLARAKDAAQAAGVDIELVEEDMRRFLRPRAFDAAVNLYTSFGYFLDEAENLRVARNVRESLAPGGIALFEMIGKEVLAGMFRERWWAEFAGGLLLEERQVGNDWEWIQSRWIVVREGTQREFRLKHRVYSGAELRALLEAAGFAGVELHGSLDGAPYDRSAKRLVGVARAP